VTHTNGANAEDTSNDLTMTWPVTLGSFPFESSLARPSERAKSEICWRSNREQYGSRSVKFTVTRVGDSWSIDGFYSVLTSETKGTMRICDCSQQSKKWQALFFPPRVQNHVSHA